MVDRQRSVINRAAEAAKREGAIADWTIINPEPLLPGWGWYVAKHEGEKYRAGLIPPNEALGEVICYGDTPGDALNNAIVEAIHGPTVRVP